MSLEGLYLAKNEINMRKKIKGDNPMGFFL